MFRRRRLLTALAALPVLPLTVLIPADAWATHYPARLCGGCGFGNKKENCVVCSKWAP